MSTDVPMAETKPEVGSLPKKSKGGMKLLILGCVVFVCLVLTALVAGLAFAFFSNKNVPVFSDVVEKGENVVLSDAKEAEMIQNDITETLFVWTIDGSDQATLDSDVVKDTLDADTIKDIKDGKAIDSMKYDASLSMDLGAQGVVTLNVDGFLKESDGQFLANFDGMFAVEDIQLDLEGEARVINDTLYVEFDQFPSAELGLTGMGDIEGQWLSLSSDEAEGVTGGVSPVDLSRSADASHLEKLKTFIQSEELKKHIDRIDDEVYGGVRTNCSEIYLDQAGMAEVMTKYAEIYGEEDASLATGFESYEYVKIQMCSGRIDKNLYRLSFEVGMIQDGQTNPITIELIMTDHNKVDDVAEVPEGAVDFQQYLEELLPMFLGTGSMDSSFDEPTIGIPEDGMTDEELLDLYEQYDLEGWE